MELQQKLESVNVAQADRATSKTEKLIQDIRKTSVFRQLVPVEAGIGYPIPIYKKDLEKAYIKLPFYGQSLSPERDKKVLFPPFALITLDWSNLVPVEYLNLRFRPPESTLKWEGEIGTFPHSAVAFMTVGEYREKRSELLAMYDEFFDSLTQGTALSTQWSQQFGSLLQTLMEPGLKPYYRAIGTTFFDRFLNVQ